MIEAGMVTSQIASWIPILAAGTGKSEAPAKAIGVRLAEIAMLLAFGGFWLNKIETQVETLSSQVSELQIQVAIVKTRTDERLNHPR